MQALQRVGGRVWSCEGTSAPAWWDCLEGQLLHDDPPAASVLYMLFTGLQQVQHEESQQLRRDARPSAVHEARA